MRRLADEDLIRSFMVALGAAVRIPARIYLTGGATAVLFGWRASTIDVDISLESAADAVLRSLPELKERLQINVELASPAEFIPELPGWQDRSRYIGREGSVSFVHYDFYAQALSKIERGHTQDESDVQEMLRRGLVAPAELWRLFERIEPLLYRYPAIEPRHFKGALEAALAKR